MLSRPLVSGTVGGLMLGDVDTGVAIGTFFEMWHLGGASLGAATPEQETWSTLIALGVAVGMGVHAGADATPAMWTLGILVGAPAGSLGQFLENRIDVRAQKYAGRAQRAVSAGELDVAARQSVRALWPPFLVSGLFSGFSLLLGWALFLVEALIPLFALQGLAFGYAAMTAVAAGVAITGSRAPHRYAWATLGVGGALGVYWLLQRGVPR